MNMKQEKAILGLSIKEICLLATPQIQARIDEKLANGYCSIWAWEISCIIYDVLQQYLPKKTLNKMGIRADWHVRSTNNGARATEVHLNLQFRKSHPCYNYYCRGYNKISSICVMKVRYKRGDNPSGFKCLENEPYYRTILSAIESQAKSLMYLGNRYAEAAKTLLVCADKLSEEDFKSFMQAAETLYCGQHSSLSTYVNKGNGYATVSWTDQQTLKELAGLDDRTQRVLREIANGTHAAAIGVDQQFLDAALVDDKEVNHAD